MPSEMPGQTHRVQGDYAERSNFNTLFKDLACGIESPRRCDS